MKLIDWTGEGIGHKGPLEEVEILLFKIFPRIRPHGELLDDDAISIVQQAMGW